MLQFFIKGGLLMIPLALCSLIGLVIIFERLIAYKWGFKSNERDLEVVKMCLAEGKIVEAKSFVTKLDTSIGRMTEEAICQWEIDRSLAEKGMETAGYQELNRLQRGLSLLDTIVTASPLLGLLGTVTGIIRSFTALSVAEGAQTFQLSQGIAEALYTTAFGLLIAVPALFFLNFFNGIVEKKIQQITAEGEMILKLLEKVR